MTDQELRDALDAFYAHRISCPDSEPKRREQARVAFIALIRRGATEYQLVGDDGTRFIRDMWIGDEAIADGYGLEDLAGFLRWLDAEGWLQL